MATLRAINLGIRFLLELAALGCAAHWGWTLSTGTSVRVAAAVGLPFLVAIAWALFISPKARFPTGRLGRAALGLVVFLAAALALFDRGQVQLALGFACVAIISSVIVYALPQ